jgi:hypothetical protein
MATSYGNRPVRIRFEDGDSNGLAEFFDGSETGADVSIDGVLLKDSKVSNLSDPTASSDAASKGWVEAQGYADIGLIIALG